MSVAQDAGLSAALQRHAYPGARDPDRRRSVDSDGIELAVYEWGEADAEPLILAHGAFDFARTFNVFAPLLADAGYRVVAWDHRGHGDSAHAALYSWAADERDMMAVVESTTRAPCVAVGHSKGGAMLVHAIQALPGRFKRYVAIDGLPFRSPRPDDAMRQFKPVRAEILKEWLDHRRTESFARKPGSVEQLAQRRARMNPRLSHQWLCYLVTQGARCDADGWRWKIDPSLRIGGFGPHRARWVTDRLPGFPIPMLALFGTVSEPMGWRVNPADLAPYFPAGAQVVTLPDTGHFIHIERPQETAALVLDFLKS